MQPAIGFITNAREVAYQRSLDAIDFVTRRMNTIVSCWLVGFTLLASLRIVSSPTPPVSLDHYAQMIVPYALVALAPIAGFLIARAAFRGRARLRPASIHLAAYGRWESLRPIDAVRHQSFGPVGFMASLVIGMMLNVVLRTGEYLTAIPPLTSEAPEWGLMLFWMATLDTVVMNFFYMVCFAMALRTVPLFPKMLLYAWMIDILMQLGIARTIAQLDPPAAVAGALQDLLSGNINKVLISVAVWLPYLILSERVNVTYRHRIAA